MSSLSGSGTRALLDVHMATLRWTKSRQKGDLYNLAFPGGTIGTFISHYATTLMGKKTCIARSSETRRSSTCVNPWDCFLLYRKLLPV